MSPRSDQHNTIAQSCRQPANDQARPHAALNVDCNALDSQFDWFRNIETGEPLTGYVLGRENKLPDPADPTL